MNALTCRAFIGSIRIEPLRDVSMDNLTLALHRKSAFRFHATVASTRPASEAAALAGGELDEHGRAALDLGPMQGIDQFHEERFFPKGFDLTRKAVRLTVDTIIRACSLLI